MVPRFDRSCECASCCVSIALWLAWSKNWYKNLIIIKALRCWRSSRMYPIGGKRKKWLASQFGMYPEISFFLPCRISCLISIIGRCVNSYSSRWGEAFIVRADSYQRIRASHCPPLSHRQQWEHELDDSYGVRHWSGHRSLEGLYLLYPFPLTQRAHVMRSDHKSCWHQSSPRTCGLIVAIQARY